MATEYQIQRSNHMIELRKSGKTYTHIAGLYKLHPSRVRDIIMNAERRIENEKRIREKRMASVQSGLVKTIKDFNNLSVDILVLPARARNCLNNEKLFIIGDVVNKTDAELLKIPNFGRKSLNRLKYAIDNARVKYGFERGMSGSDYERLSIDGKTSIEHAVGSLAKLYKGIDDDDLKRTAGVALMSLLLCYGCSKDVTIEKFDRLVS